MRADLMAEKPVLRPERENLKPERTDLEPRIETDFEW